MNVIQAIVRLHTSSSVCVCVCVFFPRALLDCLSFIREKGVAISNNHSFDFPMRKIVHMQEALDVSYIP